jgi:uncharacterized protein (DUF2225 family)
VLIAILLAKFRNIFRVVKKIKNDFLTILRMKAASSYGTSAINYQSIRHHNSKDCNLQLKISWLNQKHELFMGYVKVKRSRERC